MFVRLADEPGLRGRNQSRLRSHLGYIRAQVPLWLRRAGRLEPLLARGDLALVLGGNCTIVLGVMAALRRLGDGAPGLLYLDRHDDINTPESTTDGPLDWVRHAHAGPEGA